MSQFDLYSEQVMKYFKHPRNVGIIKNADGIGTVGNPRCGDVMKVYIKIGKRPILTAKCISHIANRKNDPSILLGTSKRLAISNKQEEYIKDIKVQTLGCGAAIATSSMATEMVKGKSLEEAFKLSNKDVAEKLGGLPPVKMHCSLLAEEGIRKAIEDYRSKIDNKNS